jgi:hypothetical protein
MTAEITATVATEIGDDLAQELEPRSCFAWERG